MSASPPKASSPPPKSVTKTGSSSSLSAKKKTTTPSKLNGSPKKVSKVSSSPSIEKFGTQAEKAKLITVFPNAEINHAGADMLVSEKKYRTYEQLLEGITKKLGLGSSVMKLYDPDLKLVQPDLKNVVDGGKYLAVSKEGLDKEKVPKKLLGLPIEEDAAPAAEPAPVVAKSEKPVVSAYKSGEISKFGTQAEKAKRIIVFPNAVPNHLGKDMLVSDKKYKTFDQVTSLRLPP